MAEQVASFHLTGLDADRPASIVAPDKWTGASNINFRYGVAERRQGWASALDTPDAGRPEWAMYLGILGAASRTSTDYCWYGGREYGVAQSRIGQVLAGVDSDVTPYAAAWPANPADPGLWTGGLLNNYVPVINDQANPPVYWDIIAVAWQTMANYDPLGAPPITWTALRPHREFLIGMGRLKAASAYYSDTVYWSDAAPYNTPPTTWVAAATNQAGSAILPGGGEIVDGATLAESFYVYKRWGVYRMRYVGGNYVFAVEPVFHKFGAFSQNCIAEGMGLHYVFTGTDVIAHDGQQWQSICRNRTRKLIRDNISATYSEARRSFLAYDGRRRELWLGLVPTGQSYATKQLVIDTDTGEGGLYTGDTYSHIFQSPTGDAMYFAYPGTAVASTGLFGQFEAAASLGGVSIAASLTKEGVTLGRNPGWKALVRWVRPRIWPSGGAATTITIEVGGTNTPDATPAYASGVNFVTGTDDKMNVTATPWRYNAFRFTASQDVAYWRMTGFDVGYELVAEY